MLSHVSRLRVPALVLLLAVVAVANAQHPPADKHAPQAKHDGHHGGHAKHKEPSAIHHVMDSDEIHISDTFWPYAIHLWSIPLPFGYKFQITKFMVLELIAALVILAIFVPMGRRLASGAPPRGGWDNAMETLLSFVRDQIAKPNIGPEADRYVPFLWTLFLFILVNNLLGMFPFLGSATASIYVTGALALVVFFAIHGSAILAMGSAADHGHGHGHGHEAHDHGHHAPAHAHEPGSPVQVVQRGAVRYVQSLWPQIDVPFPMGLIIKPLVFVIEVIGLLVRNAVLAVRLFANMFAGHMVLATILVFIYAARNVHPALWGTITLTSVLGILALSLLELFVAFLQAYIFTFLTSLFMGMAITPQH